MAVPKLVASKLTSKAQTTVPQEVRAVLGIGPGDLLGYRIEDGRVSLVRLQPSAEAWLATNREALLEMAAWDRENEIFEPDQRPF
ncbi:hypothetical protein GCM10011611_22430 [Aliidongia dinghuensis]|uniref:SpoVT-AbrB domain-containing protein n=1 Tax=Aliidongia dinghuensis TaxID=1867774 RepID=A0A8J2YSK7_9PROT|nr:type II toxin-antitoxin system PrlF family antitoxin [Aliidongia dinghuensis]GGF16171.1 hypothetical protein GCM10011611_22430 [Aliidongia dinghuensis]